MKATAAVLTLLCTPVLAAPTGFAARAPYASGAAIVEPAAGGEYVHAAQAADSRLRTRAILTALPERQTYVFFSAEEEQVLLRYRDQQLAARATERPPAAGRRRRQVLEELRWPRVVVRGGAVCVPELASSEAADWRAHLVCHADGETK